MLTHVHVHAHACTMSCNRHVHAHACPDTLCVAVNYIFGCPPICCTYLDQQPHICFIARKKWIYDIRLPAKKPVSDAYELHVLLKQMSIKDVNIFLKVGKSVLMGGAVSSGYNEMCENSDKQKLSLLAILLRCCGSNSECQMIECLHVHSLLRNRNLLCTC